VTDNTPDTPLQDLLHSGLVTEPTRRVLTERLAFVPPPLRFFTPPEADTLRALAARLFPAEHGAVPTDFVCGVDTRLANKQSDGWRYDILPPDDQMWRALLLGFNQTALAMHTQNFAACSEAHQDAVLASVHECKPPGNVWQTLSPKRAWEDMLAELSEIYYSQAQVQAQIGCVSFADGRGWHAIGLNKRETWERDTVAQIPLPLAPDPNPTPAMPEPAAAIAMPSTYPVTEPVDAVIIGTGAGGAPVFARLAQAGLRVVALEAGQAWTPGTDFATDERSQDKLFWNDERLSAGDDPIGFGRNNSGIGVGGSTLHYTAYTPRAHPDDLRLHTDFGVAVDWPISYDDLAPYYDELEQFLGISGPTPYPWGPPRTAGYPLAPLPLNSAAQLMQRGCSALGLRTSPAANAALSAPYYQPGAGWRPACTNRGYCQAGCSVGAKGSMDVTYIPLALQAGGEVRPECFVTEIETGKDGRVSGVVYTQHGKTLRQATRAVFLCGGAIETPRLLLINSLANASGQVGKNFMAHTGLQVWGQFAEETRPWKGIPGGLISEDTHRPKDADFAGGYLLQSIGVMPVTYASQLARGSGLYAKDMLRHMEQYNHVAGINILGEGLPYEHNRVELSNETDARGLPKPRIFYTAGDNETRLTAHANRTMRAIWDAAGATNVWGFNRHAHIIGTCRMGKNPANSVVNSNGEAHDVPGLYIADNSIFPTALSCNPALTIMALSLRIADRFLAHR